MMNKDIDFTDVQDIVMAVVDDINDSGGKEWNVYLVNFHDVQIDNVLVSSEGFGNINGQDVKTTVLRHFLGNIGALDYVKVEPIMEELFSLNNRYWVSFYKDGQMFDKRYVFEANSIQESEMTMIPFINRPGVFLR